MTFFLLSLSVLERTLIFLLCNLMPQSLLPMTEVYENTSIPWRRGIPDVSRGTKSKVVSAKRALHLKTNLSPGI